MSTDMYEYAAGSLRFLQYLIDCYQKYNRTFNRDPTDQAAGQRVMMFGNVVRDFATFHDFMFAGGRDDWQRCSDEAEYWRLRTVPTDRPSTSTSTATAIESQAASDGECEECDGDQPNAAATTTTTTQPVDDDIDVAVTGVAEDLQPSPRNSNDRRCCCEYNHA